MKKCVVDFPLRIKWKLNDISKKYIECNLEKLLKISTVLYM